MTNMNKIYTNHRAKPKGKDKGSHNVYHISVPQHRGLHQGYIGYSLLDLAGLPKRYRAEVEEAFSEECSRKPRRILHQLKKYGSQCKFKILMSGLTKEEAKYWEGQLRPKDNRGDNFDPYNWNDKAGG
jgi:hypothetical protein